MIIEKIYLPKWMAWFIIVIFVPILIVLEYEAFYGGNTDPLMGALFGFIFIFIIVMMVLVSYRRIPYMIIERQTKANRDNK
jgi:hypothetical protein